MSKIQMSKLSLQKGDILVVERSFNIPMNWAKTLADAGKAAGINFSVPVVFVDKIDGIAIVRMGQETQ